MRQGAYAMWSAWGEGGVSGGNDSIWFPLKTETGNLRCYQIGFLFFFFGLWRLGLLNECTCGFPNVSYVTMWPCKHIFHTPFPAFKLGCKWVFKCLEFYFIFLSGETDFTSLLMCPHLFLQIPQAPEHFQTPLSLWLPLFLFFLSFFFFYKASGLTLLFIT